MHPSMTTKVRLCEDMISYVFNDKHLCWEALQMAGNGVNQSGDRRIGDGNKRLAIIGNCALDMCLSVAWYATGESKGTLLPFSSPACYSN